MTKVGGVALGLHGVDTLQSGGRQLWTGRDTHTLTSEGSAALAQLLGVTENDAIRIGEGVDTAVPIALTFGLAAARVVAVRSGRIVLAEHEAKVVGGVGGHTIRLHVGLTDQQLLARLTQKPWMRAVSTFSSEAEAEQAISFAVRPQRAAILAWAKKAPIGAKEVFRYAAPPGGAGRVLVRGSASTIAGRTVRIVFKKEAFNGKLFYILTGLMEP